MGKENELIEAARSGNLALVQKHIVPKNKISVLQTLIKLPHINCQDSNGGTSLHYASLNNHKSIVEFLLQHKALANIPDNKGCYPLHLAAWAGNISICELILNCETSHANVNVQNLDGDTALHLSAQHGHLEVVKLLLRYSASPILRNLRNELPLDLAVTYCRDEIVKTFLSYENHLKLYHWFCECDVPKSRRSSHRSGEADLVRRESFTFGSEENKRGGGKTTRTLPSPVHLAARNGRLSILKMLLSADFDVNAITSYGSALHESVIHGRKQIFSLLLDYGVDMSLRDEAGRNVLDLLNEINTPLTEELKKIYYAKYNNANKKNFFNNDSPPESIYSNIIPSSHQSFREIRSSVSSNHSSIFGSTLNSSTDLDLESLQDFTKMPGKFDLHSNNTPSDTPKKPPRRKTGERLKHTQSTSSHAKPSLAYINEKAFKKPDSLNLKDIFNHISPPPIISNNYSNKSGKISLASNNYSASSIDYLETTNYLNNSNEDANGYNEASHTKYNNINNCLDAYKVVNNPDTALDNKSLHDSALSNQNQGLFFSTNRGPLVLARSSICSAPSQDRSIDSNGDLQKSMDDLPTPDHAPPSPATAIKGIQTHINHLSFTDQNGSCDAITYTDPMDICVLEIANQKTRPNSSCVNRTATQEVDYSDDKDLLDSDEMDKEIIYKSELRSKHKKKFNPNFPVFKNHELVLNSDRLGMVGLEQCKAKIPIRSLKEKVSGPQNFDEAEEWAQIEDLLMLSLSGGLNSDELVKEFDEKMSFVFSQKSGGEDATTIGSWLESIEMRQYEKLLTSHGFDDIRFINSEIMEEDDLQEIGIIVYSHRQKILDASRKLDVNDPRTDFLDLSDWLEYLNLSSHLQQFVLNGFTQIHDLASLWDFHLNSIIGIDLIGHRKRIIWSIKNLQTKGVITNDPVIFFNRSLKSPLNEISLFKDYTYLNQISQLPKSELNTGKNPVNEIDKLIINSNLEKKEILSSASCDFIVQYIGSTEVHELADYNISKNTISLIKSQTQDIDLFPTIQLSISFSMVWFSHLDTKNLIYEHNVGDVFCACQDPTDVYYFAYVSRHSSTLQHFCHLFLANSATQSTEIILTLGEAFDLAYEKVRKEKISKKKKVPTATLR